MLRWGGAVKGIGSRKSRVREAKVWSVKCLGGQRAERESFALWAYIVGRVG